MDKIQIEVGIPIPPDARSLRTPKYPLAQMKVGDSFFSAKTGLSRLVSIYKKKNLGTNFTVRKVDGGWRVWRTK